MEHRMAAEVVVAATAADLAAARIQMAMSLGWHIVVACFGPVETGLRGTATERTTSFALTGQRGERPAR
jgi:hypothetical protein